MSKENNLNWDNISAVKAENILYGNDDTKRYSSVIRTYIDSISNKVYLFDSLDNVIKLYNDSVEKLYDFEMRLKMIYSISNGVVPQIPLMTDINGNFCIELEREFFAINLAPKYANKRSDSDA